MKYSTTRKTTKYKRIQVGGDFNDREKRRIRTALDDKNLNEIQMTEIINILSPLSQIVWKTNIFYALLSELRTIDDNTGFAAIKRMCTQMVDIILNDVDVGTDSEKSTPDDVEFMLINDGLGKRSRKRKRKRRRTR